LIFVVTIQNGRTVAIKYLLSINTRNNITNGKIGDEASSTTFNKLLNNTIRSWSKTTTISKGGCSLFRP
jgi:hypothetical protein